MRGVMGVTTPLAAGNRECVGVSSSPGAKCTSTTTLIVAKHVEGHIVAAPP